jgi:hypothetical protein
MGHYILSREVPKVVDAVLRSLRDFLGPRCFDAVMTRITEDYLHGETDIRAAIAKRPDLFERALIGILGEVGEIMLVKVCAEIRFENNKHYSNPGDLARCLATMPKA